MLHEVSSSDRWLHLECGPPDYCASRKFMHPTIFSGYYKLYMEFVLSFVLIYDLLRHALIICLSWSRCLIWIFLEELFFLYNIISEFCEDRRNWWSFFCRILVQTKIFCIWWRNDTMTRESKIILISLSAILNLKYVV